MKNKKKTLLMSLAAALLVAAGVFGTLAYLIAKTDPITNTFTVGNIDINLTEDEGGENKEFKMVPGNTIKKDPKITVEEGSENAWIFVKVEESENLKKFINWTIAEGWTELEEGSGVYYLSYGSENSGQFYVLKDNEVLVSQDVTKEMMDAIQDEENETEEPTLTFTAYAVQKANIESAKDAWDTIPADQK